RFRASGPIGDHEIRVYTGYMGQSYLNHEQAPNAYLPRPRFVFRVTPGAVAAGGHAEPYQPQRVPAPEITQTGAHLSLAPAQGPVQTRATMSGEGIPARASVSLVSVSPVGRR